MKKVVLWGLGGTTRDFLNKKGLYRDFAITAFTDNNSQVWHTEYMGVRVVSPSELSSMIFDYIVICSLHYKEIRRQLEKLLFVEPEKIITCFEIEEHVKRKIIEKYKFVQDREIQDVIGFFGKNPLNVYGSYINTEQKYLVNRDQDHLPYIIFDGKRMYFPDSYSFIEADGKQFVADVLYDQKTGSPHQYIREADEIKEGSVIVDAGTCEGNFALQYIEKARKIYLVEADRIWMQALQRTFQPYKDKVVLCHKFLTRYNSESTATLDSLVCEKVDFLKMDIEGAEIDALMGAKRILKSSNARCAICSYHKENDEENIRFLLESFGYFTSTSRGYMCFVYDENFLDTLDLRRGIVYGNKPPAGDLKYAD